MNQKNGKKAKIIWFLPVLLVGVLLLSIFIAPSFAKEQFTIDLTQYTSDLKVYNTNNFSNTDGTLVETNVYEKVITEAGSTSIYIGDQPDGTDTMKNPMPNDIALTMHNAEVAGSVNVLKVNNGENKTLLYIEGENTLSSLDIADNAKLEIVFNKADAVLNVKGTVSMGKNSSLSVSGNTGGSISVGKFDAKEASNLTVSNCTFTCGSDIQADSISLDKATVDVGAHRINAKTMNITGGAVSASLVDGETINLADNCDLSGVKILGAANDSLTCAEIIGLDDLSQKHRPQITRQNYTITYQNTDNTALTPAATWPVKYRVETTADGVSNTVGVITEEKVWSNEIVLPEYTEEGKGFGGWLVEGEADPIINLEGRTGDIVVKALLISGKAKVRFSLGYEIDNAVHDNSVDQCPEDVELALGDSFIPKVPARFGWRFTGWKITSGNREITLAGKASYTAAYADAVAPAEGTQEDPYIITMEAQWKRQVYQMKAYFPTRVPVSNIRMSTDNGDTWMTLQEIDEKYEQITYSNSILTFTDIEYQQTLGDYFLNTLGFKAFPVVKDASADPWRFTGFVSRGARPVNENTSFSLYAAGNEGLLDEQSEMDLYTYDKDLELVPYVFDCSWDSMLYDITTDEASDWKILVNGEEPTPDKQGVIHNVPRKAQVTFRFTGTSSDFDSISDWLIVGYNEPSNNFIKVSPTTQDANAGQYDYTFEMPAADIACVYVQKAFGGNYDNDGSGYNKMIEYANTAQTPLSEDIKSAFESVNKTGERLYFDLYRGSILFEENWVQGRKLTGFWSNYDWPYMSYSETRKNGDNTEYYYVWSKVRGTEFAITSNGKAAPKQNRIKLEDNREFSLIIKDCVMQQLRTQAQIDNEEVSEETANLTLGLIENRTEHRITLEGKNTIPTIYENMIVNSSRVSFVGERGKDTRLTIGGYVKEIKSNSSVDFYDLTIKEYDENFYLIADGDGETRSVITLYRCNLDALHKTIRCNRIMFEDCPSAKIKNIVVRNDVYQNGSSNVYVGGYITSTDVITVHIYGKSNLVVENGILSHYMWNIGTSVDSEIDTEGYVVVKGVGFITDGVNIRKGTVIANMMRPGGKGVWSGGRVITNFLINGPDSLNKVYFTDPKGRGYDNNLGVYSYAASYGDNAYLLTNIRKQDITEIPYERNLEFTGTELYLFGYCPKTGNTYNIETRADDAENPISKYITAVLNNDRQTVKDNPDLSGIAEDVKGISGFEDKECFWIGDTSLVCLGIKFSGSTVMAAGNITLFNNTTVSGGNIWAAGNLACKQDLTITGGTIEAKGVGTAPLYGTTPYDVTKVTEDGHTRWAKTEIKGGNIKTDRIGALSNGSPHGTLVVEASDNLTVTPRTGSTIQRVSDIYVGHLFAPTTFESNPYDNVRFAGTGALRLVDEETLQPSASDHVFAPPTVVDTSPTEYGTWRKESTKGDFITKISKYGVLDDTANTNLADLSVDHLAIYAYKQYYNLNVIKMDDVLTGGAISQDDGAIVPYYKQGDTVSMAAGSQVTVEVKNASSYGNMVVLWYRDNDGNFCNVTHKENGKEVIGPKTKVVGDTMTITFTMPENNTDLYITDTMPLYLDCFGITINGDGFRTEFAYDNNTTNPEEGEKDESELRKTSAFSYAGSYEIQQQNITDLQVNKSWVYSDNGKSVAEKQTLNQIYFASGSSNNGRTYTFKNICQKADANVKEYMYGMVTKSGQNIDINVNGAIRMKTTYVAKNTELSMTVTDPKEPFFAAHCCKQSSSYGRPGFDLADKGALELNGFYLKNIYGDANFIVGPSSGKTRATLTNCTMGSLKGDELINAYQFGSGANSGMGPSKYVDAAFYDCKFNVFTDYGFHGGTWLLDHCNGFIRTIYDEANITIQNGSDMTLQSRQSVYNHTQGKNHYLNIHDSKVTFQGKDYFSSILVDNSELNFKGRDNSGNYKFPGYAFVQDLTVRGDSEVNAKEIYLSGFLKDLADGQSQALVDNIAQNNYAKFLSGAANQGLLQEGGVINAEFIGGDKTANITVTGGTMNVNRLGTRGELVSHNINQGEIRDSNNYQNPVWYTTAGWGNVDPTKVEISGGVVNITENGCLGGVNSVIDISGGTVNLADNAVIGMTQNDFDREKELKDQSYTVKEMNVTVNGGKVVGTPLSSIVTNTGKIYISSNVTVGSISAKDGYVNITDISTGLENPYTGVDKAHNNVGVVVNGKLEARNISVLNDAVVYTEATHICADKGVTGTFTVKENPNSDKQHTAIYAADSYGHDGAGEVEYTTIHFAAENDKKKNVYGTPLVMIYYHLNDDTLDPAENPNPNNFESTQTTQYMELQDPVRLGYEFKGWYENEDFTGDKVERILKTNFQNVTLYAKWEKIKVKFSVIIDGSSIAKDTPGFNLNSEIDGLDGTLDGEIFTFNKTVAVDYRDTIIGLTKGHLINKDYEFKTFQSREFYYDFDPYKDTALDINDKVDESIMKAYLEAVNAAPEAEKDSVTLKLNVVAVSRTKVRLRLDLNRQQLITDSSKLSADFEQSADFGAPSIEDNDYIMKIIDVGTAINTVSCFSHTINGKSEIRKAIEPGYTFKGWNSKSDGTGDIWLDADTVIDTNIITEDEYTCFYAQWTLNEYTVEFNAGNGNLVTFNNNEPSGGETRTASGTVSYDNCINGNIGWKDTTTTDGVIPYAWQKGYIFQGWSYKDDAGKTKMLTKSDILNIATFPDMNTDAKDGTAAITFNAVYRQAKVTYNPEGGTWKASKFIDVSGVNQSETQNTAVFKVDYTAPLAGYSRQGDTGNYSYDIIYTTAAEYDKDKKYKSGDYRETIKKKGYTFMGWYETEEDALAYMNNGTPAGNPIKTAPAYKDITLYAAWRPNTYNINLHPQGKDNYPYTEFSHNENDSVVNNVQLTVDSISINGDGKANWPSRDPEDTTNQAWYTYNKGTSNTDSRYLLGFTFNPLDPGTTDQNNTDGHNTYVNYGNYIKKLYDADAVITKEAADLAQVFTLPDDKYYNNTVIPEVTLVPDYPDGCTIDLYAIYRETSLVFIEYVKRGDTVEQKVLHTSAWDKYSDYPMTYDPSALEAEGLKLVGWYVNGTTTNSVGYPTNDSTLTYEQRKQMYESPEMMIKLKEQAAANNTYDIKVYTVFAAQLTPTAPTLTASSDPPKYNTVSYEYKIPNNIQSGTIQYDISNLKGLKLAGQDMMNHLGDSVWEGADGTRYKAGETAAIKVKTINSAGEVKGESWLTGDTGSISKIVVGPGWKLKFTLVNSWVMDKSSTGTFDLKFNFTSGNPNVLEQQWIDFKDFTVNLTPSIYEVEYDAVMPNSDLPLDQLVTDWKKFDPATETQKVKTQYGTAMLAEKDVPTVTGYLPIKTWTEKTTSEQCGFGDNLSFKGNSTGKYTVKAEWMPLEYELSEDEMIQSQWDVKYNNSEKTLNGTATDAVFEKTVTLTKKTADAESQFVWLDIGDDHIRMDQYEKTSYDSATDTYTFPMPASNVKIVHSDVLTLYLEDDNITITETTCSHKGWTVEWKGRYVILQNKDNDASNATENILSLSGDLADRSIKLGNLNVSKENSINLAENSSANLTIEYNGNESNIKARNILVPANASLNLEGKSKTEKGILTLTPDVNTAAIGGRQTADDTGVSGNISMNNVSVSMVLPSGSYASGIGPGAQNVSGGTIALTDCNVEVKELVTAADAYHGSWIGGDEITSITVTDSSVLSTKDSALMTDPYVVNGKVVELTNTQVGEKTNPVHNPLKADSLTLDNTDVYQNIYYNRPSLCAQSTTVKGGSTVEGGYTGTFMVTELYNGTLYIEEPTSRVRIADTQILDITHGDITISEDKVVQGTQNIPHTGSYRLIDSYNTDNAADPIDLTVNGMTPTKTITVWDEMTIGNLKVNNDTEMRLENNLTVSQNAELTDYAQLNVTAFPKASPDHGIIFKGDNVFSSSTDSGTYSQTNGFIQATGKTFGGNEINVNLTNATVGSATEKPNNLIAENMILDNSNVNAAELVGSYGLDNPTVVQIKGTTSVSAKTIGALSEQSKIGGDQTFTFVLDSEADFTHEGTLRRDLYRLKYSVPTGYDVTGLPSVLRETTVNNAAPTVTPEIPEAPKNSGDTFNNWYIIEKSGPANRAVTKDPVIGFKTNGVLTAQDIANGELSLKDNTVTLTLNAWIKTNGTGVVAEGRQFDTLTDSKPSVTVYKDYAWTAEYHVTGSMISGSSYQISFDEAVPVGTKLTLAVMQDPVPKYYYYCVDKDNVKTIELSEFIKMGTVSEAPSLLTGVDGTAIDDHILVAVDYSQVADAGVVENKAMTLQRKLPDGTSIQDIVNVGYGRKDTGLASINAFPATATGNTLEGTVSYTVPEDTRLTSKYLMLMAEVTEASGKSIPYTAKVSVSSIDGAADGTFVSWLDGHHALINMGPYAKGTDITKNWAISGLNPGEYTITWKLFIGDSDTDINVMDNMIASAVPVTRTRPDDVKPSMKAVLTALDGETVQRTWYQGTQHKLTVSLSECSSSDITFTATKQNALYGYDTVTDITCNEILVSDGSATAEVTFPSNLAPGVYRISFSLNESTRKDNVYFSFVVK